MSLTYAECQELTKRSRQGRKKLKNNVYLQKMLDGSFAVQMYQTDIVTIHQDGTVTLNNGGWYTVTTKANINKYAPCYVHQIKGEWYVSERNDVTKRELVPFVNGMVICPTKLHKLLVA
jgi:hypothetical protein